MKKVTALLFLFIGTFAQADALDITSKVTSIFCITQNEDTATIYKTRPAAGSGGQTVLILDHTYQNSLFGRRTDSFFVTKTIFDFSNKTYNVALQSLANPAIKGSMIFRGLGGNGIFTVTNGTAGSGYLNHCAVGGTW